MVRIYSKILFRNIKKKFKLWSGKRKKNAKFIYYEGYLRLENIYTKQLRTEIIHEIGLLRTYLFIDLDNIQKNKYKIDENAC